MIEANLTILANQPENLNNYLSEDALVQGLKLRKQDAFEHLYDNYKAALYGSISRMIRPDTAAEDLLQELFVKIFNSIDSYDVSKGRLYTWLMQITRYLCIDKLRSAEQKQQQKNRNFDDLVPALNTQMISGISTDHIGLKRLVSELPPEQREILEYMYFEGYTQTETAEALNLPLGTVKTRSRYAIIKLRAIFQIK
ncbi:MAG: RNA polymerase sigma factor [Ferruginibacter sp.]